VHAAGWDQGRPALPSSEYPFHREIYRRRPDLEAVVHAHPSALVAFSICRLLPETRVHRLAHAFCGRVAYAPYACPGQRAARRNIAEAFAAGADCVMLENHGVVVGGRNLKDAFQRFETLEWLAQMLVKAAGDRKPRVLPADRLIERMLPEPGELATTEPANREKELRAQLARFVPTRLSSAPVHQHRGDRFPRDSTRTGFSSPRAGATGSNWNRRAWCGRPRTPASAGSIRVARPGCMRRFTGFTPGWARSSLLSRPTPAHFA